MLAEHYDKLVVNRKAFSDIATVFRKTADGEIDQLGSGLVGQERAQDFDQVMNDRFKAYEVDYPISIIANCGKLIMLTTTDQVSKFTYVEFHDCTGKMKGAETMNNFICVEV